MRVRSPKPGWLYVRLAWRRQLGRFTRWSPPPAHPCRCIRCQRKRDERARVAAEYARLRHAFLYGAPGFRPRGPQGPGIVERILAGGETGVDWHELLPQPNPAAVKAEIEKIPGIASVSIDRNGPGKMVSGSISVFVKGVQYPPRRTCDVNSIPLYLSTYEASELPTINLPKTITITMKLAGRGFQDFLCPAQVSRTRTGAWLVKGRGPTRRYSMKALACRAARARDQKYRAEHRIRGPQ